MISETYDIVSRHPISHAQTVKPKPCAQMSTKTLVSEINAPGKEIKRVHTRYRLCLARQSEIWWIFKISKCPLIRAGLCTVPRRATTTNSCRRLLTRSFFMLLLFYHCEIWTIELIKEKSISKMYRFKKGIRIQNTINRIRIAHNIICLPIQYKLF